MDRQNQLASLILCNLCKMDYFLKNYKNINVNLLTDRPYQSANFGKIRHHNSLNSIGSAELFQRLPLFPPHTTGYARNVDRAKFISHRKGIVISISGGPYIQSQENDYALIVSFAKERDGMSQSYQRQ